MRKGGLSVDQPQSALAIDPRGDQSHYATRTVPSFPCTWKEGQPEGSLSVLDPLHRAVRLSCRAVWQYNVSVMDISAPPLRLTLGPLRYEFRAHDAWGQEALAGLRRNLDSVAFSNVPDRITHLLDCRLTPQEHAQIDAGDLPDCLVALLPENSPRQGWELTGDESGYLSWCHARTCHAIWSYNTVRVEYHARFQLPWQTLLRDIVALGGGILHGGLVALHGRGCLVTAPPGGGKTTAISRLPASWQVLADDAALIWPTASSAFEASPLPTWSVLLGRNAAIPAIGRWRVGTCAPLAAVVLLKQGDQERLESLRPVEAVPHLYRGLCEHPRVVTNREPLSHALFNAACALTETVPTWELTLTRTGAFLSLLEEALFGA